MYKKDMKTLFPSDLADLCREITCKVLGQHASDGFTPEAAIVNFYPCHPNTSMGGHLGNSCTPKVDFLLTVLYI